MRVLSVIILVTGASQALASDLEAKLEECRALQSNAERMACYDAITVAEPAETPAPEVVPPVDAEPPVVEKAPAAAEPPEPAAEMAPKTEPPVVEKAPEEVAMPSPEENFGKSAGEIQREQQQSLGQEEVTQITSRVAKLRQMGNYKLEITLENGQVWHQISSSFLRLKVGDDVVIKRGALDSYRLVKVGNNRPMQVRRRK